MIKRTLPIALVALLAGGVASGAAMAQNRSQDSRDVAALAAMKVALQQAIATAENQAGGRAFDADVSQQGGATASQLRSRVRRGSRPSWWTARPARLRQPATTRTTTDSQPKGGVAAPFGVQGFHVPS